MHVIQYVALYVTVDGRFLENQKSGVRHTISEDLSQDRGCTADGRDRKTQHIGIAFYRYSIYSVIVLVAVKGKFRQVLPDKPSKRMLRHGNGPQCFFDNGDTAQVILPRSRRVIFDCCHRSSGIQGPPWRRDSNYEPR